ncbi:NADPH-dependent glutamate synthase [Salinivirga cyanobacteriivorans]
MERFEILQKREFARDIFFLKVYAPVIAGAAQPGQFLIVINDVHAERIPLTISDYSSDEGTVDLVVQAIGFSTRKIVQHEVGECFADVVGPLGNPSEFVEMPLPDLQNQHLLFVAGGIGAAPIYAQVKYFQQKGIQTTTIIGARNADFIILEAAFRQTGTALHLCTDDGSRGFHGNVTELLSDLVEREKLHFDHVITIGPLIMMKFVEQTTRKYNLPCVASLNSLMIDGTGMCGACRVTIDGKTRFTCVDGPEFDAHKVDFNEALTRQQNKKPHKHDHYCNLEKAVNEKHKVRNTRIPVREQPASIRSKNFNEVCYGYNAQEAMREAERCLQCKKPRCVGSCPVHIDIPGFIAEVANGNFQKAYEVLSLSTSLPAVCGRVCPQETQCEGECVLGIKGEPVAIGKLERFVADWALSNVQPIAKEVEPGASKVAVVGSGPAGLTCAGDLAKMGYRVTVFEALQKAGGVLEYGIPEFRLPKKNVVAKEVDRLSALGVDIQTDYIIGRAGNVDHLLQSGYDAVFIGAGAGLPRFMNLPGENLNGVYSANEFLTRVNLMQAYRDEFDTPVELADNVVVIGGGNVAMDAARTAVRLGARVSLVYRRGESELPARQEEIHHAKEEGIDFQLLTNPVEFLGDANSDLQSVRCVRMELGEPDASGRRRPEPVEGSDFIIEAGTAIVAIGTSPNPLLKKAAPEVSLNKWNCIDADNEWGKTTQPGVFAGGDVVTGAATVIEAMGAGKRAAKAIDNYVKKIKNQSYAV